MRVERAAAGLWWAVGILAAIGVAAAINRAVFPADAVTRIDPVRAGLLRAFARTDPFIAERAAELDRFDGRYRRHPIAAAIHVVPAALFLGAATLQFSSRLRRRHIRIHRWSGRVLVAVAVTGTVPAFYFGLADPYGGLAESIAIGLFGGLFLLSLATAFMAIRRHDVARHREWMIRAFALALGISIVRLVGAAADLALTPVGIRQPVLFVLSIWIGWAIAVTGAEWWIRMTRANPGTLNP